MQPLIFNFFETPSNTSECSTALLEYDSHLQLSVLKGTKAPAFDQIEMGTQTMTKTWGEASDSDDTSQLEDLLVTSTYSATDNETNDTDVDPPSEVNLHLRNLMSTMTMTLSIEQSDSDR